MSACVDEVIGMFSLISQQQLIGGLFFTVYGIEFVEILFCIDRFEVYMESTMILWFYCFCYGSGFYGLWLYDGMIA